MEEGLLKGETCNRDGCTGIIDATDKDGCCSCHINPPCSYCTTQTEFCPVCGWDVNDDIDVNQPTPDQLARWSNEALERHKQEDLFWHKYRTGENIDKLDIRHESHTHFSMIKIGVFPKGTETMQSILNQVRGTFGGRFERFTDYSFKYIAYTD